VGAIVGNGTCESGLTEGFASMVARARARAMTVSGLSVRWEIELALTVEEDLGENDCIRGSGDKDLFFGTLRRANGLVIWFV